MKKLKKFLAVLLCLVMLQVPAEIFTQTAEVQAATTVKQEIRLNSKNGKYYYYENGKRVNVRSKWITVKSGKQKGTYYFQKNGTACAATKLKGINYNVTTVTIKGKVYGFNNKGQRVTGLYYKNNGTCYYFNSNGTYNSKETAKYRVLVPKRSPAIDKKSAATAKKLLQKFGKLQKTVTIGDSCAIENSVDRDYLYPHFILQVARNKSTGKEYVLGIYPR